MIRVMVGYQQRFAEQRLTLAMRYFGKQIVLRIGDEILHLFQVLLKLLDASLPGVLTRRGLGRRPVVVGKLLLLVFGIAAKFENILLRDPHVLQQFPRRVWRAIRLGAAP